MKLGVNVDHVATLRQARDNTAYPDPAVAALLAEYAGADSIVVHLREDRRHIKERDVIFIKGAVKIPLNLEMSISQDIVDFACKVVPEQVTLVPEKRQELTTEGGLDLIKNNKKIAKVISRLMKAGIKVSLFIDPLKKQIKAAKDLGIDIIEINTGAFSSTKTKAVLDREIKKIKQAAKFGKSEGFFVAAGHGLDYENLTKIIKIKEIAELNIGHSIICRSVFIGVTQAVEEMISLLKNKN
ncbi:MAG: pyridoxine 5'-phosphate synthase [Candidatus Omnitrophica bacterium]|nr:pyridoxine 5'-phosphate synthase [Candidatus Omnitrophota bacterium]